jgi:hypothetical protein
MQAEPSSLRRVSDHWEQELAKAFTELKTRIERLAQVRASTHAAFHARDRSEEWKQRALFEQELTYEVGFLREIRDAVDARITERQGSWTSRSRSEPVSDRRGRTEWAQEPVLCPSRRDRNYAAQRRSEVAGDPRGVASVDALAKALDDEIAKEAPVVGRPDLDERATG